MLALLLVVPLFVSNDPKLGGTLVFPAILIGILSTVCWRRWRSKSVDVLAFHTHPGGQLHIWFEKPDAKSFRAFCETLTKKAEQAWRNRPLDPSHQSLAGEIAALKQLKESGVLNDAEFERAKSKILEQAEQRKIGFN